ncbi:hypothetical protein JOF29_003797 [Kribbella aluminosa]|uniref:Uncharacterized protein n=1 Tax=Kribbella aluminosa TaxID=416017 RepID=A0ABS4UM59_9ACTN|nr:hypothetical protein [Kribbella aluminosa]MBP2352714.1 hypothetical protein [Kribbella aluminosa]
MGTQEEEAKALADLERVRTENAIRDMQRQEELKKLQEQQNKMVADPGVGGVAWPDNEVQARPQTGMDKVAGALRVGQAGDLAFARDLLNSGQPPLGSVNTPDQATDGAKESAAGTPTAKPALGLG